METPAGMISVSDLLLWAVPTIVVPLVGFLWWRIDQVARAALARANDDAREAATGRKEIWLAIDSLRAADSTNAQAVAEVQTTLTHMSQRIEEILQELRDRRHGDQ